ncbi:hypothetical protein JXR93_08915 [bacterium]|nr:hypothetical protein [bacterium]
MIKKFCLLNLLFTLFLVIFLTSCTENCPSFNKDNLKWIPYKEGGSITLYNQELNSSIILPIVKISVSHTSSYEGFNDCGGCLDFVSINSVYAENYLFNYDAFISSGNLSSEEYTFKFNDGDIVFSSSESSHKSIENYSLNGVNYELVRVFENSETYTKSLTNEIKYSKLIVAKGVGVIAIIDNQNRVWSIINQAINDINTIKIKSKDGC